MRRRDRSPFHRAPARYRARVQGDEAEILLYDEIGFFGIRAQEFVRDLKAIQAETIHLRINSPGGDIFEGLTIFNALRALDARLVVHIDGLAASIASVIALAGAEVRIADNGFFMIHNPFSITIGDATEHRKAAELLDKVSGTLADAYVTKSGMTRAKVEGLMAAETWFTAEEAEDAGFVDAIDGAAQEAAASFDLSVFEHAPAALAAHEARPTVRDVERLLRDAGFSRSKAAAAAAQCLEAAVAEDGGEDITAAVDQLLKSLGQS